VFESVVFLRFLLAKLGQKDSVAWRSDWRSW